MASERRRAQRATSGVRAIVAFAVGAVVGAGLAFIAPWQLAVLGGWDSAASVLLVWIWLAIGGLDDADTARIAQREDSSRTTAEIALIMASVVCLIGVGLTLVKAADAKGSGKALLVTVAVASVVLSWATVHSLFTLRYARLYYNDGEGGIDFKDDKHPAYIDFAYIAFTVGMTFQVSDTDLQARVIRATVLRHALLSYLFGTVIVAMTINVVAGLLK